MHHSNLTFNLGLNISSRLQPIVDIEKNEIIGYEVLSSVLEHNNAECFFNGLLCESAFEILKWQVSLLNETHCNENHRFCLNILPEMFLSLRHMRWICSNSDRKLALEVDFSLLDVHSIPNLYIIDMLRNYGHEVWLDDFNGSHDNKLLLDTPWDVVKIDKSVLWNSNTDEKALTSYITTLKKTHKKVLMEGIETMQHLEACKRCFVELGQGFYWPDTFITDYNEMVDMNRMIDSRPFVQL